MSAPPSLPRLAPEAGALLERDQELEAYLLQHRLGHLRFCSGEVLSPHLTVAEARALRWVLSVSRLPELATSEAVRTSSAHLSYVPHFKTQLPLAAFRFLESERALCEQGRAQVGELLTAPAEAALVPLWKKLTCAFERLEGYGAPLPRQALEALEVERLPEGTGFRLTDSRRSFGPSPRTAGRQHQAKVTLTLDPPTFACTCEAEDGCAHALLLVQALLHRLHTPSRAAEWLALSEELAMPAWARALREFDLASAPEEQARQVFFSWRVFSTAVGLNAFPYLHTVRKDGRPTAGTRTSASRLLSAHAEALSPRDLQAARHSELSRDSGEGLGPDFFRALVAHPRVSLEDEPEAQVAVLESPLGIAAEERSGELVLCPAVAGTRYPLEDILRRASGRQGESFVLFEPSARRVVVVSVPREAQALLLVLKRHGAAFPREAYAELLERLGRLSVRLPVSLPETVMGSSQPPQTEVVLRLRMQSDASVRLELRVRPLAGAPSFTPGEGPPNVHGRNGAQPVHTRRRFSEEKEAARAFVERLPLEQAFTTEEPFTYTLPDPQAALEFIQKLEDQTPRPELEWQGAPLKVAARAGLSGLKVVLEKKRDWFGLSGGLSVEGERVSLAVLLDAARRKQRFVLLDKSTYVDISGALQHKLERLADHTWSSSHGLEVGPSAAQALDALEEAGAEVSSDRAWRELSQRIYLAGKLQPRLPRGLKAKLRPYQQEGFEWLCRLAAWGAGGVLADDMGLGKTVQALALLLERAPLGPQLVLAPTSVGFNWVDEAQKFAPSLGLHVYAEAGDRKALLSRLGKKDVLVVSYGLLARDLELLKSVRFATAVLDEAQALKNAGTQRARAARDLQADFKFALSGTPLENHLGELWSLYRTVFPGLLGSWDGFRDRFATPIEKRQDPTAAPALARVLQPFLLRRTKDQVARDLPPRTEVRVPIVLSPAEWQLYEDARLAALSELETPTPRLKEQQRRIQVLAALTRLRLAACHPKLYDAGSDVQSSKLARLCELVEELRAEGHRALVFSQFTTHLTLAHQVLVSRGMSCLYLDGSTPRAQRKTLVGRFQSGEGELFLISLKAGGFGLNLTGADYVIHLDPWWNPAVEDQASDRAHRIGQTRPVTVFRLVSRGTIEEQILALHEDKRALVSGVLEGKDQAGKLSTSDLLTLLSTPAAPLSELQPASTAKH